MGVAGKFIVCCYGIRNRLNSKLHQSTHNLIPGLALISHKVKTPQSSRLQASTLVSACFTCECLAWVLFPQDVRRKTCGLSMQEEIQFPVQKYTGASRLLPTNTQDFFLPHCFMPISFQVDNSHLRAWHKVEQ